MTKTPTRTLQHRLRASLEAGASHGYWTISGSTQIVEMMAGLGFDWLGFDLQHGVQGPLGGHSIYDQIMAADGWGVPSVVRAPWSEPGAVMQIADAGASAIILPMINTVFDAERAVSWLRYPPLGVRSMGPVRASLNDPEYSPATANNGLLIFVMIETREAYESAREILSVPGVDGVFIGPWDLTISMTGETRGPDSHDAMERIFAEIRDIGAELGVFSGIMTTGGVDACDRSSTGYQLIASASDLGSMRSGAQRELTIARGDIGAVSRS